jgi:DNA-nicking Smr family endonuclease
MAKKSRTNDQNDQEDDAELFQQMMGDVRPLEVEPKMVPRPRRRKTKPSHVKQASLRHEVMDTGPYAEREQAPAVGTEELLLFSRSGIQHRVMKQLKRGDIAPQAKLDLHGQTITQAGQVLHHFLQSAREQQLRCVLVVHGKGSRSADGKPRIKSQVNQWLRDTPAVLAFCSAQARHGGAGAVYVLLKTGT